MESRVFCLNERLRDKEAEHNKAVAEVMESATANYTALEQEHFKALNNMKEAEERARTEAEQKAKIEAEVIQLQKRSRTLRPSAFNQSARLERTGNKR
jgi:vacuolar-type H+-ATPase subunit I/STV1